MTSVPRCPVCAGEKMAKWGKRSNGVQRWMCNTCKHRTTSPIVARKLPEIRTEIPKSQIYVVTAVQNATRVHEGFWKVLRRYCEDHRAKLLCIPTRYRNPTSIRENRKVQDDEWWDEKVIPFLYDGRILPHPMLEILGDVKISPTAVSPLSGLESFTGGASCLVPHPKAEMRTVATPHYKLPKILMTTGAATEANYSVSKAGAKGRFHHVIGAVVVEKDGERFHLRRINATEQGSFTDLGTEWAEEGKSAVRAEALVMGDTHVGMTSEAVLRATFGKGGLVKRLRPKRLVWHDILDFSSQNWHDSKRPFVMLAKRKAGKDSVSRELKALAQFLFEVDEHLGKPEHIFPFSNHPDMFRRWIEGTDWRGDLENAETYLSTALKMAKAAKWGEHGAEVPDPFKLWMETLLPAELLARCTFLGPNDSYEVLDVELGMHGHLGPNGARGSVANLSRVGVKAVIGHVHSPAEKDGLMAVGTNSRLFVGYNLGPSSWLHSDVVLYPDGKRQGIHLIDGAFEPI